MILTISFPLKYINLNNNNSFRHTSNIYFKIITSYILKTPKKNQYIFQIVKRLILTKKMQ